MMRCTPRFQRVKLGELRCTLYKNRINQRLSEWECGVCPLTLLCCVPLDVKHDQLKVTRCAQGNCDSLCAIHVLGTLEIRESLVPVTREVENEN